MTLTNEVWRLKCEFMRENQRHPDRLILNYSKHCELRASVDYRHCELRASVDYRHYGTLTTYMGMLIVPTSAEIPGGMEVR